MLPGDTTVIAERITPTSFPVYTLNVDGNVPPTQLRDLALYQIRPALSRVPGVGPITVTAGYEREVEVKVDPARAEAAGLTVDDVGIGSPGQPVRHRRALRPRLSPLRDRPARERVDRPRDSPTSSSVAPIARRCGWPTSRASKRASSIRG